MKVTIRVDAIDDTIAERLTKVLTHERIYKALVYREISEKVQKPHYQGYIEFADEHYLWWKQRWFAAWKGMAKSQKSSVIVKKETYLGYIAKTGKDGNQPFYNLGHTDDEIKELASKNVKGDTKPSKKTDGMCFEDRMWEAVTDKFYDKEQEQWRLDYATGFNEMKIFLCEIFPWMKGSWKLFYDNGGAALRAAINWNLARIDPKGWSAHVKVHYLAKTSEILSHHLVQLNGDHIPTQAHDAQTLRFA